jgi:hypothetical protein
VNARIPIAVLAFSLAAVPSLTFADARLTLTGKVTDASETS